MYYCLRKTLRVKPVFNHLGVHDNPTKSIIKTVKKIFIFFNKKS